MNFQTIYAETATTNAMYATIDATTTAAVLHSKVHRRTLRRRDASTNAVPREEGEQQAIDDQRAIRQRAQRRGFLLHDSAGR